MRVVNFAKINSAFLCAAIIAVILGLLPPAGLAQQQPVATTANKEAENVFKRGVEAFENNDYKTALDNFTAAIKLDEAFAEAYYYRGRVSDETPWTRSSGYEDYDTAIRLNPNHADAYLRRGLYPSYHNQSSIEDFTAAIRIKPDFAEAYYHRGFARSEAPLSWLRGIHSGGLERIDEEDLKLYPELGSQKLEEAVVHLSKAIRSLIPDLVKATELKPQYIEAHSYLATLYYELGEQEKAIAAMTRVIAISPENADAYYQRGLAQFKLKEYERANKDFAAEIRLRPDDAKAYKKRVIARFFLKDFEGALEDYVDALKLKPRNTFITEEEGDPEIELQNFDQILPNPTQTARDRLVDAYYERALAKRYGSNRHKSELKGIVADLTRVLTLQPSHVAARYEKGLALADLDLHAEAINDFSEVIRLQPKNAEAYYARGVSLHHLKNNKAALEDFVRSIELSPELTKAYYEKAQVHSELGDRRSAIADLTRAIAVYSESPKGYYLRALAYESVGEHQKAIADYLQVVRLTSPGEKVKNIPSSQLASNFAAIYHRGLARFHLARILEKTPWFFGETQQTEAADFLISAERDFTRVIRARPQFADGYYQRGRARRTTRKIRSKTAVNYVDDNKGALADFKRAIKLNPRHADAYLARGEEFRVSHPEKAILDSKRVIRIDPGNAKAFYHLGILYGSSSGSKPPDHEAQLNYYSLAIKADPSYVAAYSSRAYLLQEKSPLQAVADLAKIIQLEPDNAQAYRRRAAVYRRLKDYRSALADYTRAIELDPSEPGSNDLDAAFTYVNRAHVRYALGDGKGAQDDYRQALLIRPCLTCLSGSSSLSQASKAETFLQRGLALMRRGDRQGSRQNLEQAVRLFYTQGDMPKYQNAKYHLSRL